MEEGILYTYINYGWTDYLCPRLNNMLKHLNIHIYGKVQGVYYRATAVEVANSLGTKGFARNEKDSSVYIEAEGEEETLKQFIDWCRKGPARAKVESVRTEEGIMKNYTTFAIRR